MKHTIFTLIITLLVYGQSTLKAQSDNYFQQEVNYKINVTLDDKKHFLRGDIEFEYTNNSPETLEYILFHIWPNAYKNDQTALAKQNYQNRGRLMYMEREFMQGYIDSLNFSINNKSVQFAIDSTHIDIGKLHLNKPLKPGETVQIRTPFRVKIPYGTVSRFGHMGNAYKITQWYPKPAVYDRDGWHAFPYLDMGEFYSEFGSFDVKITIPNDYVVAASGNLQNKTELERLKN